MFSLFSLSRTNYAKQKMSDQISLISMLTGWLAIFVAIFVAPITGPIITRWFSKTRLGKYLGSEPPLPPCPTHTDRVRETGLSIRRDSYRVRLEAVATRLDTLARLSGRRLELSERQLELSERQLELLVRQLRFTNSQAAVLTSPEGLTAEIRFRRAPLHPSRARADTE